MYLLPSCIVFLSTCTPIYQYEIQWYYRLVYEHVFWQNYFPYLQMTHWLVVHAQWHTTARLVRPVPIPVQPGPTTTLHNRPRVSNVRRDTTVQTIPQTSRTSRVSPAITAPLVPIIVQSIHVLLERTALTLEARVLETVHHVLAANIVVTSASPHHQETVTRVSNTVTYYTILSLR